MHCWTQVFKLYRLSYAIEAKEIDNGFAAIKWPEYLGASFLGTNKTAQECGHSDEWS